jgi:hypothetical protein
MWRAYVLLGASLKAEDCRQRALQLARSGGFFEIVYALERDAADDPTARRKNARQKLSAEAESVVRSLEAFARDEDAGEREVQSRRSLVPRP